VGEGLGDSVQPQSIICNVPHSQASPTMLISGTHGASHSAGTSIDQKQ